MSAPGQSASRTGRVFGTVQGVGLRPLVARLAAELALAGRVRNEGRCVRVELEGAEEALERFAARLSVEAPRGACIDHVAWETVPPRGLSGFVLEESVCGEAVGLTIPPDLATCDACLAELGDPAARRRGYPFTSCASCGPRFTIVRALPYDRSRTTMAPFAMCAECRGEYEDPHDRRHHAQPIACPRCGPRMRATAIDGAPLGEGPEAVAAACEAIRRGAIVAVKGLGGFQLWADACDDAAVSRLRTRKRRPDEPFAVMVRDLDEARRISRVSALEAAALASPAAPIVLCARAGAEGALSRAIAPGLARIGLMLPGAPLHHLLLDRLRIPVVATSANLHGEPIVIDDGDALSRLASIADLVLGHDRAIERRCDDALVHEVDGRIRTLRLGRGLAPARVAVAAARASRLLCHGAHLRNAPAALDGDEVVLWPHVGDLDSLAARRAAEESIAGLRSLLALTPEAVVVDAHPDYASTRAGEASGLPLVRVHHHHAHVAACLAEHGADEAIGVAWDGVGLGEDGTAWGGEILHVTPRGARRLACLRPFALPGGDAAARDGRRALGGVLAEIGALEQAPSREVRRFAELARSAALAPRTTSAGRLLDAVAALLGVCERSSYEGHAAMVLEALAHRGTPPGASMLPLPFTVCMRGALRVLDWEPAVRALLGERDDAVTAASRFHATLIAMLVAGVDAVSREARCRTVALGGGCFANRILAEGAAAALRARGFTVLLPAIAPPGDGGIALGQAWVAMHRMAVGDGEDSHVSGPTG